MLAIIQSRMSSQRLPGKSLMKLGTQSILERTIERTRSCMEVDSVLVATSTDQSDNPISNYCKSKKVNCFRGSLENLIDRMHGAAQFLESDYFLRISGDSPFIDPAIIKQAILLANASVENGFDLVTNIQHRTFPKGQSVEILSTHSLEQVSLQELSLHEKEHVTPFFYNNSEKFKIISFTSGINQGNSRQCVDNENDFIIAEKIVQTRNTDNLGWKDIQELWSLVKTEKKY